MKCYNIVPEALAEARTEIHSGEHFGLNFIAIEPIVFCVVVKECRYKSGLTSCGVFWSCSWRCTERERERQFDISVQMVVFMSTGLQKDDVIGIKEDANLVKNTKKETNMKTIDNKTLYSNFFVLTSPSSMLLKSP